MVGSIAFALPFCSKVPFISYRLVVYSELRKAKGCGQFWGAERKKLDLLCERHNRSPPSHSYIRNSPTMKSDQHCTLRVRGQVLDLTEEPVVMGILNHTPDSFYAGSRIQGEEAVEERIDRIIAEGAKIIDVGGYSSRPDADDVSPEEEWRRLHEVLTAIRRHYPDVIVSVDTFRGEVARRCIEEGGADIINDISGGLIDPEMLPTAAQLDVPYILMHMRGTPKTMQKQLHYDGRVADGAIAELLSQLQKAHELGMRDENIIVDPGFGFSKNTEQNWEMMADLDKWGDLGYPLLVGISRKSMIYKLFGYTPFEALNGTTFLNTYSLLHGAHILRVHDVRECVECVRMYQELRRLSDEDAKPID